MRPTLRSRSSLQLIIMQILYLILTLFISSATAVPLSPRNALLEDWIGPLEVKDGVVANVNDFLDKLQPRISRFILDNNLDPLKIDDVVRNFWVIPPIIPIIQHEGTIALTSGTLKNLSKIKRQGNAVASYEKKLLELDMVLGFDIIYASYDYYAKVLIINHYGDLDIIGKTVHARVRLQMDFENYEISLKELTLSKIESITVAFRGSVIFKWLVTPIANAIIPIFKDTLSKTIEGKVVAEIEKSIAAINHTLRPNRPSALVTGESIA